MGSLQIEGVGLIEIEGAAENVPVHNEALHALVHEIKEGPDDHRSNVRSCTDTRTKGKPSNNEVTNERHRWMKGRHADRERNNK